jgi:5-methylcytosine-specific restriction endonuclease McrA
MSRPHEFPAKVRVAAYKRAQGACEGCTAPLLPGRFQYDHRLPVAMGGASSLDNCVCLCSACHGSKTAERDIPTIAKSNRVRNKHIGAATKTRHPLPGGRQSKWKKRIDGTVVPR